jgi:hypothetical protein
MFEHFAQRRDNEAVGRVFRASRVAGMVIIAVILTDWAWGKRLFLLADQGV